MRWYLIQVLGLLLSAVGILLFNNGFFLTRMLLKEKSTCSEIPSMPVFEDKVGILKDNKDLKACWTSKPLFKRAIVIVIDALRYDFAAWNDAAEKSPKDAKLFENKLGFMHELLINKTKNSLLVPFYADPPTTTMQRLKGIMTGSLPTYLELKEGVVAAGIEVTEDNFVDMLLRSDGMRSRNVTFMGDDTWTALFPERFHRQYPYPSFIVTDLHTVDNGVIEHLIPEMKKDDWDVIIAHFLGVDHCGHRFGPDNHQMSSKLTQINKAISDAISLLDNGDYDDTVLMVFGDHGMTEDGNHGGGTKLEVGSALFVYSPSPILLGGISDSLDESMKAQRLSTIKELKTELGLLHPDFVDSDAEEETTEEDRIQWLMKRRPRVGQIDLAPTLALLLGLPIPFSSLGSIIPELFFVSDKKMNSSSNTLDSEDWLDRYERLNEALGINVAQVSRYLITYSEKTGTEFSDELRVLIEQADRAKLNLDQLKKDYRNGGKTAADLLAAHKHAYSEYTNVLRETGSRQREAWATFDYWAMFWGFLCMFLSLTLHYFGTFSLIQNGSLAQDASHQGFNGSLQRMVCGAVIFMQMGVRISNSFIDGEAAIVNFLAVSLGFVIFLSLVYQRCNMQLIQMSILFCVSCRVLLEMGPLQWIRGQECQIGDWVSPWLWLGSIVPLVFLRSPIIHDSKLAVFNMLFTIQRCLTAAHWLLQAGGTLIVGENIANALELGMVMPRAVYFLAFPIAMHSMYCLFFQKQPQPGCKNPLNRTASALYDLSKALLCPLILLLGPGSPLIVICLFFQLEFLRALRRSSLVSLHWLVVVWSTLSMCFFFATGHESSFNKLHYASPFVGFDNFEYYRGAVMMGANTFGTFILMIFLIPTLISLEFQQTGRDGTKINPSSESVRRRFGELKWFVSVFGIIQALRAIVMTAFVVWERGHLLVWETFAPKYVFDNVTVLVVQMTLAFLVLCIRMSELAHQRLAQ